MNNLFEAGMDYTLARDTESYLFGICKTKTFYKCDSWVECVSVVADKLDHYIAQEIRSNESWLEEGTWSFCRDDYEFEFDYEILYADNLYIYTAKEGKKVIEFSAWEELLETVKSLGSEDIETYVVKSKEWIENGNGCHFNESDIHIAEKNEAQNKEDGKKITSNSEANRLYQKYERFFQESMGEFYIDMPGYDGYDPGAEYDVTAWRLKETGEYLDVCVTLSVYGVGEYNRFRKWLREKFTARYTIVGEQIATSVEPTVALIICEGKKLEYIDEGNYIYGRVADRYRNVLKYGYIINHERIEKERQSQILEKTFYVDGFISHYFPEMLKNKPYFDDVTEDNLSSVYITNPKEWKTGKVVSWLLNANASIRASVSETVKAVILVPEVPVECYYEWRELGIRQYSLSDVEKFVEANVQIPDYGKKIRTPTPKFDEKLRDELRTYIEETSEKLKSLPNKELCEAAGGKYNDRLGDYEVSWWSTTVYADIHEHVCKMLCALEKMRRQSEDFNPTEAKEKVSKRLNIMKELGEIDDVEKTRPLWEAMERDHVVNVRIWLEDLMGFCERMGLFKEMVEFAPLFGEPSVWSGDRQIYFRKFQIWNEREMSKNAPARKKKNQ